MKQIGRYLVVRELGRGAMGVVFEARDPLIGRTVAIKTICLDTLGNPSEAEWLQERLFREARSAGALSHPGIVVVHDVGQQDELAFIAMERVDGPTLEQVLATNRRPGLEEILSILRQTAAALDYAHQNGVVHRDIKPANLMLHKGSTVKITDFGIAKITSTQQLTRTGMVMGTPSYMSPEQITAQPLDGRSDQFSLGVIGFELLTGRKPFQADNLAPLVHQIVYEERPSARSLRPDLPEAADIVLRRALSRDTVDRYPSCTAYIDALDRSFEPRAYSRQTLPQPVMPEPVPPPAVAVTWKPPSSLGRRPVAEPGKRVLIRIATRSWIAAGVAAIMIIGWVWIHQMKATSADEIERVWAANDYGRIRILALVGNAAAQNQLGSMYANAQGVLKDDTQAVAWYRKGAEQGYAPAEYNLGSMYDSGAGVPKDASQAVAWYRKAADQGHASAQNNIGIMYESGTGVPKDASQAVAWYRKAADQGHASAQNNLGIVYESGTGVPKDASQAVAWYRKSADQGYASAQNNLGIMYDRGTGVPKDDAQAVAWYRSAANQGYAPAQYNLGSMYESGTGVPQDASQAVAWYRKAAGQGLAMAQNSLGLMYESGIGVPQDASQAVAWYRKAADQGYAAAQNNLGIMYDSGTGVPKDDAQAVTWYLRAVDQGNASAEYNLGSMYEYGRGVPKDLTQAINWYRKAAQQGNQEARDSLKRLGTVQ